MSENWVETHRGYRLAPTRTGETALLMDTGTPDTFSDDALPRKSLAIEAIAVYSWRSGGQDGNPG